MHTITHLRRDYTNTTVHQDKIIVNSHATKDKNKDHCITSHATRDKNKVRSVEGVRREKEQKVKLFQDHQRHNSYNHHIY